MTDANFSSHAPLTGPTIAPPGPTKLNAALQRNISAITAQREAEAASATREEKVALAITAFTGSMRFVYIHLVVYTAWIVVNLGLVPGAPKFDPSFVMLAMEASVEAIFLSTFVLISQNRTAAASDKRADLDLQINLLAEHELTKLASVVTRLAEHLRVPLDDDPELEEVQRGVAPEAVLDELDSRAGT